MHEIWKRLLDGNEQWATGGRDAARRAETVSGQYPMAVVLGCSDSRVPVETVFGQGIGDLFVIRTAGHTLDTTVLGSVEYAVGHLQTSLIVVLGHDRCGAVAAAIRLVDEGVAPPGHIRGIAERIALSVRRARWEGAVTAEEIMARHTQYTVEELRLWSAVPLRAVDIVAARYDLARGTVTQVYQPVGRKPG
ncbi:carbonic anhydrase [Actinoplanes campanulatus]|uniref:Carbonic anhydrase n=1 Tax=Actinoplanes campanulatus TaxID=113559 RepID=A0A7W5FD86_9ACTN|nr:carbonic anhydrase [Actinoplanes campanulatus]MBB3094178.1 carbonic anhydrase [Actinoplanes campanulatus]